MCREQNNLSELAANMRSINDEIEIISKEQMHIYEEFLDCGIFGEFRDDEKHEKLGVKFESINNHYNALFTDLRSLQTIVDNYYED